MGKNGRDSYSTESAPMPAWMLNPSLLPKRSVAQVLAANGIAVPAKKRGRR